MFYYLHEKFENWDEEELLAYWLPGQYEIGIFFKRYMEVIS